jgi:hypothetical protein
VNDLSAIGAAEKREMVFPPSRGGVKAIRIIMKDGRIYKNTLK